MELSLKYSYCRIWRLLVTWSSRYFEVGFYDADNETLLWSLVFRRANTACTGRGLLSPIERDWSGEIENEAWAHLQKPPRR